MNKNTTIMSLATLAVGSLIFVTWAMTTISTWMVRQSIDDKFMQLDGISTEMFLMDAFWYFGRSVILPAESVVGILFLWLLWRRLYRA